jgi:ceramide glucosyltransferase
VIVLLSIVAAMALAYQLVALAAALRHLATRDPLPSALPAVSILKPLHGADGDLIAALRTLASQDYPEFEILAGVGRAADPAGPAFESLAAEFPNRPLRLIAALNDAPNQKAGVLAALERQARFPVIVASDADIAVPPGYLRSIVAPLAQPGVGLVTCLYRARAASFWGAFEALGVATDFAPSTLVAPLVGVREFGLGSTLALRAPDLARLGGFASVAEHLADDYQIGRQVTRLGLRVWLSRTVVETSLEARTPGDLWRHQVRWARTVRLSRGDGYIGLPVTFATLWAIAAAAAGAWPLALALFAARMAAGLAAGIGVLRCPITARLWPLIPLRDIFAAAVWLAGLLGSRVDWRGQRLTLTPDGRIKK